MSEDEEKHEPVVLKYPILADDFDMNYEVLEIIKETEKVSHLIIEDLEYGDLYYLKRMILPDDQNFKHLRQYYKVLEEFSQSTFAHDDMIKLWSYAEFFIKAEEKYESLVFYEWGEPDCIDLEKLTTIQTLKFLKNIAEILESTFKITKLTHSNITLDNIILVGKKQLKLAGWRPFSISSGVDDDYSPWSSYINKNYGRVRLDICQVGLLWFELLQFDMQIIKDDEKMVFPKFISIIHKKLEESDNVIGGKLLQKIFNFEIVEFPYSELKHSFDELVVEVEGQRIKNEEESRKSLAKETAQESIFTKNRDISLDNVKTMNKNRSLKFLMRKQVLFMSH